MALYQPVWVFPDVRNGLGQGTVDADNDLTVSWHISGQSAMVAFRITIYSNNAASTQLYTTGKKTDGCPTYGTNAQGEQLFFSYTIPAATLASSGVTNGNEYKLVIKQWWGATDTDSVTQSSASVFVTRKTPTLTISTIGTVASRFYTFTGNYAQQEDDTLNWFRWQIAVAGQESEPFYDTQNVYGTMNISAYYDGFFSGTSYSVKLTAQTENGIEVTTGWVSFPVQYTESAIAGLVEATCVHGKSAAYIEWNAIGSIPGTADGTYSLSDGLLTIPQGSSVHWDDVNDSQMSFDAPWGLIWKGEFLNGTGTFLTLERFVGNLTLQYDEATSTITLKDGSTTIASQSGIVNRPITTIALTPTNLYIRAEYVSGALYPTDTLYPSTTLYPASGVINVDTYNIAVTYTQEAIEAIRLNGAIVTDYIEVTNGDVPQSVITGAITNGTYEPSAINKDYFKALFDSTIDGDNMTVNGEPIVGVSLYRRDNDSSVLMHLADMESDVTHIYDYSVANGRGPFTYYLFLAGETSYSDPLVTSTNVPLAWDWSLLECEETGEKSVYKVIADYHFGKNLSSSPMSNNNKPSILNNFTKYPIVQQAPQNYKSGSLTSLIGCIDYELGAEYYDTILLAERLYGLSTTQHALFLKDRKGRLMRIRISDSLSMQTADNTREQAQTITLSWVEVGGADGVSLIAFDEVS